MAWNEPGGNKGKDPWGGDKQNPPDLDEALRKLQRKFSKFVGGDGNGEENNNNNGSVLSIGFIFVIIALLYILSGIFIVGPAEEGVVLRFGRYVETVGPGPHWIPRGIDSRYIVNVENVSDYSYTAEMLNKDENIVSVSVAVQYRIKNPFEYLFNVVNPAESLQQATASALRQVVGHNTLDEILTTGREKVRREVSALLKETLTRYETGIEIVDVAMQPAKAPEEVKSAFDDAIKAQEDEQRYVNNALAYAARVKPIATGHAKRILQEAEAYKKQAILKSEGDVARFLELLPEYTRAPEVTRERMYLSTIEGVLQSTTKVLMDAKGNQNLVYLPIDKLMSGRSDTKDEATQLSEQIKKGTEDKLAGLELPSKPGSSIIQNRLGRDSYAGRGGY